VRAGKIKSSPSLSSMHNVTLGPRNSLAPDNAPQNALPISAAVVPSTKLISDSFTANESSLLHTPGLVHHTPGLVNMTFNTPIVRRQPIRPFIPTSRTALDKLIDYIVGDGPSNRYALVCKQCHVHNGMALREEFESMAFICFNCGLYNPARNATPLRTPGKRKIAHNQSASSSSMEPLSRPVIRTATNSESSDEENTDSEIRALSSGDNIIDSVNSSETPSSLEKTIT